MSYKHMYVMACVNEAFTGIRHVLKSLGYQKLCVVGVGGNPMVGKA